ncbi:BCL-6 corepressor-like protein 1 [Arapaima gigas]
MQVDPTPKSSGDGGTVSSAGGLPSTASESMVGNPPQTLPPELRGDVPPGQQERTAAVGDCGASEVPSKGGHANSCSEVPTQQHCNSDPLLSPSCVKAEVHDKAEGPKTGVVAQQWPCGKRVGSEVPQNAGQNNVNPSQPSKAQTQSVISLPPGFHCPSLFKPGQPVAFLPAANFGSPLCKITLPPGLGQIAALKEATANQFHVGTQSQSTSSVMTPPLHTYGYQISMGRPIAPETKPTAVAPKPKCGSNTSSKSSKGGAKHGSMLNFVSSSAVALPLKQPALSSAPLAPVSIPVPAPVCSSPTVASITVHTRPPNHVEKGQQSDDKLSLAYTRLESPAVVREPGATCPNELRDMPLDLSSKSKRQNAANDSLKAVKAQECKPTEASLNDSGPPKRTPMSGFGSYVIYPDALRNGAHQKQPSKLVNHQVLDPAASWAKLSPQATIASLPGTYVGVASPILASTLRSKDGKCTAFVEDLQSIAKQESISIIDQGEQLTSRGKKGTHVTKEGQKTTVAKRSNSTCLAGTPSKELLPQSFSASATLHSHGKAGGGKGVNPHNAAVDVSHLPRLMPQQKLLKQQKILQGSAKAHLATGCHGSLIKSLSKAEDKKWDQTKCPLSNLESIVKQKALETTGLTQEGGGNVANSGLRKAEVANLQTSRPDSQFRQVGAGGFSPFRSVKWKDGKNEKDSSLAAPHVTCRQEEGSKAELGEHPADRRAQRDGNDGVDRLDGRAGDADKGGPSTARGTDGGEEKQVSPLPCAKMEGIALSLPKTQRPAGADREKKTTGAKRKATGSKPKKFDPSKTEATPKASKKMAESAKKPLDKDAAAGKQGGAAKKPRKPGTPGLEQRQADEPPPSQPERKQDGARKGKAAAAGGGQLPHPEAGNISSHVTHLQSGEMSSPAKETRDGDPPRLRRGRRRSEQTQKGDWSPPEPSPPPPPPPPPPAVRRPRGRPRSNPLPGQGDLAAASPQHRGSAATSTEGDASSRKKRRRRKNRKYQNGEYITEREQAGEAEGEAEDKCVMTRQAARAGADLRTAAYPRVSVTPTRRSTSPDPGPRRTLLTRSGSVRRPEGLATPETADKPSGKRKFKSKHLCDAEEEEKKVRTFSCRLKPKRSSTGKRPAGPVASSDSPPAKKPASLFAAPKGPSSPSAGSKASARTGGTPETPAGRPVPPEVRRLIVNKNAGETLLQRAARLGYEEVVLYCLEKDLREVNRRDNAGYTALHEACARGWAHIVQLLLEHGADVNCSAQDGTRPIHDAVASDNLPVVWMLLNHGADPTLATYSGQTAVKLAQSPNMKAFLTEYFADLEARVEENTSLPWDFYSSTVFETDQEPCWEFLLSLPEDEKEPSAERAAEKDCFLFEFSAEPLLPCYHVQVSLSQGFCNWFLLSDVLKRLKMSARIFRARYPHFEVASISRAELCQQLSVSQVTLVPAELQRGVAEDAEGEGPVELVRCVPDLQGLLGSSVQVLEEELSDTPGPCGR